MYAMLGSVYYFYNRRSIFPLSKVHTDYLTRNLTFGDIYVLSKIQENLPRMTFQLFLQFLYKDLKGVKNNEGTKKLQGSQKGAYFYYVDMKGGRGGF